jgi:hypothetical protein
MPRNRGNQSGRRSLQRKVAIRSPRKTLDLRVEPRREGAVPLTLISMAADARGKAIDEEAEIDEFWCVFDVEWPINHPNLHDALDRARRNDIQLAISNPCFELWLILEMQDQP